MKRVVIPESYEIEAQEMSKTEETHDFIRKKNEEKKLMQSIMEDDEEKVDQGKLLSDAMNQGFSSFVPDMMFDKLTTNFSMAKNLFGERLLRLISGYHSKYLQKNIKIPEFQRELMKNLEKNIDKLKKDDLLTKSGKITDKGVYLASLIMYTEELDNMVAKGVFGEKISKQKAISGAKADIKMYHRGDKYKDIDIRKSLRLAIKRGKPELGISEIMINERIKKGSIYIVYCIDSSGSMKGKKIEAAKKAGIALAYKAIERKDKVGLLVFGSEVEKKIDPTNDFMRILKNITEIRATRETNIKDTLNQAIDMFPRKNVTKHIVLISDAVPTIGKDPEKETIEAVSLVRNNDITISVVGIKLDEKGADIAEKITNIGNGRLYTCKNLEDIDTVVLEDYYALQ